VEDAVGDDEIDTARRGGELAGFGLAEIAVGHRRPRRSDQRWRVVESGDAQSGLAQRKEEGAAAASDFEDRVAGVHAQPAGDLGDVGAPGGFPDAPGAAVEAVEIDQRL
jgi:hypothetical protein